MQRNLLKECKICGALENVCFHYGVRSCRACGAFFRRYLENEKECKYKCKCLEKNDNEFNMSSQANISKCKRCRLQKCLLAGMHKLEVGYLRQDICRGQQNDEVVVNQVIPQIVDISFQDRKEIDSFLLIVDAKKRIMHSFADLDDIFLQGPIFFKDIIHSGANIFSQIENFSPNPSPISTDELNEWESEIRMEGLFNRRYQKYFLVDRLICVAIARTMNIFGKLSIADQIVHLRHISYAFTSFTSSYLAWELGFETWTRKDCVMPALAVIKNEEYQNDFKFIKLSDRQFTKSVVPFKQVALSDEEYALLLAIIFTQPGAEGLSKSGKELLYEESARYTKILLRFVQNKYGDIGGARRLDECFRLINSSFNNENNFRSKLLHQLNFYSMKSNRLSFPNFLIHFLERTD